MSFRFRLQKLLDLKIKSEQERARNLKIAMDNAELARNERTAIASMRDIQRLKSCAALEQGTTAGEMQHYAFISQETERLLATSSEQVDEAEVNVNKAQSVLESATQDRRVLDRLKERHAEYFNEAMLQRERVQMDEIALSRYSRMKVENDTNTAEMRSDSSSSATTSITHG